MHTFNWTTSIAAALGAAAFLSMLGCAKTTTDTIQEYERTERLPKPTQILIHDFAVSPVTCR